ncbi:MAG: hypothetical protein AAF066_02845 [Pseudomonadota bacterium]
MKTILIIDGAENCAYDCFLADDELFEAVFPLDGQNIEFIEDFLERSSSDQFDGLFESMWKRPIAKKDVRGIDGILFYELINKKKYYPNKRDCDLDGSGRRQPL